MKLQTRDGTVYHVRFRHYLPGKKDGKPAGVATWQDGSCFYYRAYSRHPRTVTVLSNGADEVTTDAICSPRDVFTKARGREIALGRALKKLVPDVPRRAELWADYYRQVEWGQR